MLFFEQASRLPGREKGRTGDRGIIPDVGTKSLPVYFRQSFQDLKDRMVRGDVNPLTNFAFVIDVYIQRENGRAKSYVVTEVREVIPLTGDNKQRFTQAVLQGTKPAQLTPPKRKPRKLSKPRRPGR